MQRSRDLVKARNKVRPYITFMGDADQGERHASEWARERLARPVPPVWDAWLPIWLVLENRKLARRPPMDQKVELA